MKWFKHDSDANRDEKLQNVLLDYGLEGYGLYWYCLELITYDVDQHNLTFDLRHDARIIARNVGSTEKRVEEMMKYFIEIGLFECSQGHITCLKLLKRLDQSMTSKSAYRAAINTAKEQLKLEKLINPTQKGHDRVMTGSRKGHELELEEEEDKERDIYTTYAQNCAKNDESISEGDHEADLAAGRVLDHYNNKFNSRHKEKKYFIKLLKKTKTRSAYTEEDLIMVIDWIAETWSFKPEPIKIARVNRFDEYLAKAEQWRKLSATVNAADVVEEFNSTFDGLLPHAELDRDLERKIYSFTDYLKDKSINGFVAYFETFKNTASDFYFGNGFTATLDFLLKPKTLRDTRAGVL